MEKLKCIPISSIEEEEINYHPNCIQSFVEFLSTFNFHTCCDSVFHLWKSAFNLDTASPKKKIIITDDPQQTKHIIYKESCMHHHRDLLILLFRYNLHWISDKTEHTINVGRNVCMCVVRKRLASSDSAPQNNGHNCSARYK